MKRIFANYIADLTFRMLFTVGGLAFPLEQGNTWWKRNYSIPIWEVFNPPKEDPRTPGAMTLASIRVPYWFPEEPWKKEW